MSLPRPVPGSALSSRVFGQKSCPNAFAGRGRDLAARRRAGWDRSGSDQAGGIGADLPVRWSLLLRYKFGAGAGARDNCARFFGVTLQTAINWYRGDVCRPAGDKVAYAALIWPEDFAVIIGQGRLPKARVA